MDSVRLALSMLHKFFVGILGLTVVDLFAFVDFKFLNDIDSSIKTIFVVLGLIFYILAIPHRLKMQKFKQRQKKLDIQKQELDLKIDYEKYDLDKYKRDIGFKDE